METSVNRGNSGGPLLDGNGYMVGINTAIARKSEDGLAITGINFAIKSSVVRKWVGETLGQVEAKKRKVAEPPPPPPAVAAAEPPPLEPEAPAGVTPSGVQAVTGLLTGVDTSGATHYWDGSAFQNGTPAAGESAGSIP